MKYNHTPLGYHSPLESLELPKRNLHLHQLPVTGKKRTFFTFYETLEFYFKNSQQKSDSVGSKGIISERF